MIRRCIILCGWLARAAGLGADVEHYHQTLRISEFMAVNQSGIQDEDGDRSDWIEIHNPTAAAVSLEGWFLTDAAANKTQWQFPATNLLAGAHLVVFASDKNRANAGAPLHANFKLSGAGEYLGLTMPDGVTVASEYAPLFPPQAADVSCGLTPATNPPAILVPPGSSARTLVPSGPIDDAWRLQGFEPDAAWPVTPLPAGYETIGEPIAANILFVVDTNANAGLAPGDAAVLDRLTAALGHAVTVADDNAARTADAAGRDLVVVSSTVSSSAITSKFRDVAVPVINWERSLVDDFRIGATPPSTTSASHVVVTPAGAGHPAAGGLPAGVHIIRASAAALGVASTSGLAPGAQVLATANNWPAVILVEKGHLLLDGQTAPAPRIHMPWGDAGLEGVHAAGLALFDGAVAYALSGRSLAPLLAPQIATDIRAAMQDRSSTLLACLPFAMPEGFRPSSMALRMRYDDGFVAWLNGVEIARRNAAGAMAWDSAATASRAGAAALVPELLDVSGHRELLAAGDNVLAIQGLNASAADPDFFVDAELTAVTDATGLLHYYTTPTPGAPNLPGSLGIVPPVLFSRDRGYVTNDFVLTLSNALAGAEIRFTTNGAPPTASSGFVYATPLRIAHTTVIRAAAFQPGYLSTRVATMSYLFLEQVLRQPSSLEGWPQPVLSIGASVNGSSTRQHDYEMDPRVVDAPAYSNSIRGAMLAIPTMSLAVRQSDMWNASGNGGFYRSTAGLEAPVSVELIDPGQPAHNAHADAWIEGHSHDRLKRTMRLTFRASSGAPRFESRLFQDAPLLGETAAPQANSIVLRGGNNRCWARGWNPAKTTYTEDEFYRATQIAMSGAGAHGSFVHLYINGIYWGLYNPVERPDNAFAAAYLGGGDDQWFSINHGGSTNGLRTRWDYLVGPLAAKDMSQASNYAELREHLDVEPFIDYLLASWYVGLGDWPDNNWWAACRNSPPGPVRFFAWDGEWCFGTARASSLRASVKSEFTPSSASSAVIPKLWRSARANPDFMMAVADRAFRHTRAHGALSDAQAIERWLTLSNALRAPVIAESARWGDSIDPSTVRTRDADWHNEQALIGGLLAGNGEALLDSMRSHGYYPSVAPPQFSHPDGIVEPPFAWTLSHTNGSGEAYYTGDGSDPRLPGGAVNPAAVRYGGAVPVLQSARIQARFLKGSQWSALNEAAYGVPGSSTLQIAEIMYHPADPTPLEWASGFTNDNDFEFLELKNTGAAPLSLAGFRFTEGIEFEFDSGILPAGGIVLLVRNRPGFEARYGTGLPVTGAFGGALDNGGETLRARDAAGLAVLSFRYEDHWQMAADGGGHSLVPVRLAWPPPDPSMASSWRASAHPGGSPGIDDPAPAAGFQAWVRIHFSATEQEDPAVSGPDANPDGDPWPNFAEYAFVTDPRRAGTEVLPRAHLEDGLLKIVFRRLKDPCDVSYRIEVASGLDGGWSEAGAAQRTLGSDESSETVEAVLPTPIAGADACYARILALPAP